MMNFCSLLRFAYSKRPTNGHAFLLAVVLSVSAFDVAFAKINATFDAPGAIASAAGDWSVNTNRVSCPGNTDGTIFVVFSPTDPNYQVVSYDFLNTQGAVVASSMGQFGELDNAAAGTYRIRANLTGAVSSVGGTATTDIADYGQDVVVGVNEVVVLPIVDYTRGNVQLFVPSDFGSYAYSWSNGATTRDVTGLAAGNYTVTVTTDLGCRVTKDVAVVSLSVSGGTSTGGGGTTLPSASDLNLTLSGANVGIGMAQGNKPQAQLHIVATPAANPMQPDRRAIWVANGVGSSAADASFAVYNNGFVYAREVQVKTANPWPDYVFTPEHNRMSLDELERYIGKHQHLPGIPSAAEVNQNGQQLGEIQRLLLEKIEEQQLYIIELNKRITQLENR